MGEVADEYLTHRELDADMRRLAPLAPLALRALAARRGAATYPVADSLAGPVWDGVGASFTGASARLLRDYGEPWRTQILDTLLAPSGAPSTMATFKGAALQILRLEIGGDGNSDGAGSAPSHLHRQADAPTAARGWAWWLASEAVKRNPGVKIMLVPVAWPRWVEGGHSLPFHNPAEAADYVASSVTLFQAQSGASVGYVGLWASPLADVSTLQPQLTEYAVALRAALDAQGLAGTKIVCADSTKDWNCLAAVDKNSAAFDAQLAAAVGVVGNAGRPPASIGAGVDASVPIWSTSAFSTWSGAPQVTAAYGALAASNEWLETVVNATLMGSQRLPSGFIFPFGATSTGYGFGPSWHYGLVQASQPASGSWYPSVATWAIAAVTQFVPADGSWRLLPGGAGTGALVLGGYYASFYRPKTSEFVIVAQKYFDIAGWGPRTVTDESATFVLEGQLGGGKFAEVFVWKSCFSTYKDTSSWLLFQRDGDGPVPIVGDAFTVSLQAGCLYSRVPASARARARLSLHPNRESRRLASRSPPREPMFPPTQDHERAGHGNDAPVARLPGQSLRVQPAAARAAGRRLADLHRRVVVPLRPGPRAAHDRRERLV